MVQTKRELNINGEHAKLGRELTMVEFKGFTTAKIDSMEKALVEIKETMGTLTPVCAKNDARSSLNFKLICIMIVAVLGVYAVVLM